MRALDQLPGNEPRRFPQPTEAAQAEYRTKFAGSAWTDVDSSDAPYTNRRSFAFPVTVLANLTTGRSDIEPSMAEVRMGYRANTLFRNYQIDNPERYQRGRIDLSFVAIGVAPLLLIALGYGMLTGDRDSGTLRLIAAQTGGVGRLVAVRSINRLALVTRPLALGTAGVL